MSRLILAFDTSNEVVAVGLGRAETLSDQAVCIAQERIQAHRASNTKLLDAVDAVLVQAGVEREQIDAVVVGRGPGSFTGVRICMATAKGLASALEVPLFGVSTLDAVAWNAWAQGVRGCVLVAADAMRKEVYPALFRLEDAGVTRLTSDAVVKAADLGEWLASEAHVQAAGSIDVLMGDALVKYRSQFESIAPVAPEELWTPTGVGLLLAARTGGDPATLLPVYTRLSDAEETERARLAQQGIAPAKAKDLVTGVQAAADAVAYRPLDAAHAADVAAMEQEIMGSDAWSAVSVADELPRKDRTWWAAYQGGKLVGYCGGLIVDGQVQILKVGVDPSARRLGIARRLMGLVAADARDLGATEMTLEVRLSNTGAHAFYERLGLERIGVRPRYYSDREDAVIYTGPLPVEAHDVAGMELKVGEVSEAEAETGADQTAQTTKPLILAIESSCDETAAAVIDGGRAMLSDVVASQIDFHARFGGVVPEIASRKHIEAICGVCDEALLRAGEAASVGRALRWRDLDAVAVTYAPGLVGALVVGVAFAKGAAWGARKPLIAVNHLEGHLFANRLAEADIHPPMVVSLVSGGHTMLVHVRDWGDYETMGSTIDDAVGEAFDKVAKALGLGYPGGPVISRYAAQGNPKAIDFPRALLHSHDLRFSLSGLKTAVTTYINKEREAGRELNVPDIAASFEAAVVDVQVAKAADALKQTGARTFCLGGGVAANPALRASYEKMCAKHGYRLVMPPLSACGDNAAMIAEVGLHRYNLGKFADNTLDVKAHAPLDEAY